jgi:hypothetical protein
VPRAAPLDRGRRSGRRRARSRTRGHRRTSPREPKPAPLTARDLFLTASDASFVEPRNTRRRFTKKTTGYAAEVLEESRAYAAHADRASVSLDDVKLAIAAKLETQFVPPTSAEEMKAYADSVNREALPALTNRPGIHVAQEDNLLSPNYQFFPRAGAAGTRGDGDGDDMDDMDGGDAKRPVPAAAKPRAEPTAMEAHEPVKVAVRGSKRKK